MCPYKYYTSGRGVKFIVHLADMIWDLDRFQLLSWVSRPILRLRFLTPEQPSALLGARLRFFPLPEHVQYCSNNSTLDEPLSHHYCYNFTPRVCHVYLRLVYYYSSIIIFIYGVRKEYSSQYTAKKWLCKLSRIYFYLRYCRAWAGLSSVAEP